MKMKILIVDDEEMVVKSIGFKLESQYDIITSSDGQEAVELIMHHKPDLIISDIMMPFMSGLELLDVVKNQVEEKIPVILISSLDDIEIIQVGLDLGADDFVVKPINMEELDVRVKRVLRKYSKVPY